MVRFRKSTGSPPPPNDRYSAWEWSGEWTVTYETFRDMGAAFMVALVLIYILVVWEFGNFRIPLVIMAPIPLTLLGIIPAHLIMFKLGLGGEFTATSMIGWIALAGIIVRNSILLVDFSTHEVQKGVPVAEAVIRACKTRTRPIVITALALVAGSSVIFTDPIFQGMAISLASGVLVSTVLTLIVIPLGCVAASKDLYEVAAVIPPSSASVPYATAAAKEEQKVEQEPKKEEPWASILTKAWGYLKEGIILGFYLIRGLFLLLYDFLKDLVKKKQPTPKLPTVPDTGEGDRSGDSAAAPPTAGASVLTLADNAAAASKPAETMQKEATGEATADATGKERTAVKKPVEKKATDELKTTMTASVQKKPRRRGIRLKADDEL